MPGTRVPNVAGVVVPARHQPAPVRAEGDGIDQMLVAQFAAVGGTLVQVPNAAARFPEDASNLRPSGLMSDASNAKELRIHSESVLPVSGSSALRTATGLGGKSTDTWPPH